MLSLSLNVPAIIKNVFVYFGKCQQYEKFFIYKENIRVFNEMFMLF